MTVILGHFLSIQDQVDWDKVRDQYQNTRPSWDNIKRQVREYQEKYPNATDKRLADLTGFTLGQVETVTHTSHKRCLKFFKRSGSVKQCAKSCGVTPVFARRIKDQLNGKRRIPRSERYLFQ